MYIVEKIQNSERKAPLLLDAKVFEMSADAIQYMKDSLKVFEEMVEAGGPVYKVISPSVWSRELWFLDEDGNLDDTWLTKYDVVRIGC